MCFWLFCVPPAVPSCHHTLTGSHHSNHALLACCLCLLLSLQASPLSLSYTLTSDTSSCPAGLFLSSALCISAVLSFHCSAVMPFLSHFAPSVFNQLHVIDFSMWFHAGFGMPSLHICCLICLFFILFFA